MNISDFLQSGACISLSEDEVLCGWGKGKSCSYQNLHNQKPGFYFPHFFFQDQKPWRQYPHWQMISISGLKEQLIDDSLRHILAQWEKEDTTQFKGNFETLKEMINERLLQKGVPYFFKRDRTKMNSHRLRHHLVSAMNAIHRNFGTLYGFWDENEGMLGVTPEVLFKQDKAQKNLVHTMALAGTAPHATSSESFLKQEKDLKEHEWVVSGIRHSCANIGEVQVGEKEVVRGLRLSHIMTPIQVTLKNSFDFMECVKLLHPTPALGVFPKNEIGEKWLLECEKNTPRRRFGAPVGIFFPRQHLASCFVAIRNVQWDLKEICVGAGCGVIKESEFENEWKEIQLKLSTICLQLGFEK